MNRREMLATVATTGLPMVDGPVELPLPHQPGVPYVEKKRFEGVGVLRYPRRFYGKEGEQRSGAEMAREIGAMIRQGTILCFSDETDEHGNFVWDFRIEGGDPGQVKIERAKS